MSTGPNRILDEFAKLMTDAAGAAQGMRREVETAFRAQAEEFEAARDMAAKAREENAKLAARIEALEAKLAGTASGKSEAAKSTSAKPRAKT
jgi:BMFP domain-containing protein YqiC